MSCARDVDVLRVLATAAQFAERCVVLGSAIYQVEGAHNILAKPGILAWGLAMSKS